jgi:transposase-like protein
MGQMEPKFSYKQIVNLNEDQAREMVEKIRWADGMYCPHCGVMGEFYKLTPKAESKRPVRKGVYKCKDCRKQFTVTVGTIFSDSHIKLNVWLAVIHLMAASKKGVSAHQVHRLFGITYKTAWFMLHRIRHAMGETFEKQLENVVECDETYIGGKSRGTRGRGAKNKSIVFSLVERGGNVRSMKVQNVTGKNLKEIIVKNVSPKSTIMTDEFPSYNCLDKEAFRSHKVIRHSSKVFVNGKIHTNTVEGFFSLLKRGVVGTFHHVSEQHLDLYLNEFDFRYNRRKSSDIDRTYSIIKNTEGKRLCY